VTQRGAPEQLMPHPHRCENLETHAWNLASYKCGEVTCLKICMYLPHIAVWYKDGWSLEANWIDVKAKATIAVLNHAINE